jgi:hypothetical protein
MPLGGEALARAFYGGVLEIPEIPKPPNLAERGSCWFERGNLKIHLGVEAEFRPARKAHRALLVADLPVLVSRLRANIASTLTIHSAIGSNRWTDGAAAEGARCFEAG